ncbi:cohesin domain-containing protein [Natronorubrum halophilum]|uniref:cohesin domain-containing protein n=1 Tax=Natronorubrum halophilum TaxID=1702106 RepID=UPI0010C17B43|nr:cohesin domain-containing protein [Natronorubrum halophilum]
MRQLPNGRTIASGASYLLVATAVALLVVSTLGIAVGTALAGDQVAVITPSPHSVEADPGEEFTIEVEMVSDGGHGGEGVEAVDLVAQYHPDYLEITDIGAGPWLEQGEETDVHVETGLTHEEGTAVLKQYRAPAANGATGTGELATLTVAVAEDADPADAVISFDESSVQLVREWPLPIHEQGVTVEIDGGGEEVSSFYNPDPDEIETTETDDEAATDSESTDDSMPGFTGGLAALLAIGGTFVVARGTRRTRSRD